MIVDEDLFAPLRPRFGGTRRELRLFPGGQNIVNFDKWRQLRQALPSKMFTPTHKIFADDLPEPINYGDAGRDTLEVVILLAFLRHVPVLVRGIPWIALDHQAGGVECLHPQFIARRLVPRGSIYSKLRKIARDRWPNGPGDRYYSTDVAQTTSLQRDLGKLGLACSHTLHCFTESVYPIDATDAALAIVTEEPVSLPDLIEDFDPVFEKPNVALLILTDNSD